MGKCRDKRRGKQINVRMHVDRNVNDINSSHMIDDKHVCKESRYRTLYLQRQSCLCFNMLGGGKLAEQAKAWRELGAEARSSREKQVSTSQLLNFEFTFIEVPWQVLPARGRKST